MNEKPESNPNLKIGPKEYKDPAEVRRLLKEEADSEMGFSSRITPYNIDDKVYDKDPQKNNERKIGILESLLEFEKFDGPEEHDIARKLQEVRNRDEEEKILHAKKRD